MKVCGDWFTFRVEVLGSSCSFVPLVPTEHHVNPTAYRSIVADVFYVTGQNLQFLFTHKSFLWHHQFFIINICTLCVTIKYVQVTEAQEVCEADIQELITQPLTFTYKSKKWPPSTFYYLDKTVVGKWEYADHVSVIIVQWLMTQSVINELQMKALCRPLVAEPPHRRHKKSYLSSSSRMTHHQRWVIFMIPESYVTQCLLIAPTHTVPSPIVTNENKGRHVWREKYVSKWLQTRTIHIIRSGCVQKVPSVSYS